MLISGGLYSDVFFFFFFFVVVSFTAMIRAHNWRGKLISEGAYSLLWVARETGSKCFSSLRCFTALVQIFRSRGKKANCSSLTR